LFDIFEEGPRFLALPDPNVPPNSEVIVLLDEFGHIPRFLKIITESEGNVTDVSERPFGN
jgi:hypothetical protein